MEIEIRRNNAIRFSFTLKNDNLRKSLEKIIPPLEGRKKEIVEKIWKQNEEFEQRVWEFLKKNPHYDLDENLITEETHKIGYETEPLSEKDGLRIERITKVYIMPK